MSLMKSLIVATRDRHRLNTIIQTLARYGMVSVLRRIGLGFIFTHMPFQQAQEARDLSEPQRLRLVLEKLGPTFIKLGQILAARGDLLPEAWTKELSRLHSAVPALPWADIEPVILAALGQPIASCFASFDQVPLAAGSIAQVHKAQLVTGETVAVKVQRPGAEAIVKADMRIFHALLTLAEGQWAGLRKYRATDIIGYLRDELQNEFDFTREGRNGDRVRKAQTDPKVVIPHIHWQLSSETLLVQQFITGVSPTDQAGLAALNINRDELAKRAATSFIAMLLEGDIFHADLHAGNVRVLPDNGLAYLDFGMAGSLTPVRRRELIELISALHHRNTAAFTAMLRRWQGDEQGSDILKLESSAHSFILKHIGFSSTAATLVRDFMALMQQNGILLPPDLAVVLKAIVTAEGTLQQIKPDFDLISLAGQQTKMLFKQRLSPKLWKARSRDMALLLDRYADELPLLIETAVQWLKQRTSSDHALTKSYQSIANNIRHGAQTLSLALLVSAGLLGLPHLLQAPDIMSISAYVAVFAVAALLMLLYFHSANR